MFAQAVIARAVDLDKAVRFNIEAQVVGSALIEFSKQSDIQVVISPEADSTKITGPLYGTLSARTALETLLKNTGLTYSAVDDSVSVTPLSSSKSASAAGRASRLAATNVSTGPQSLNGRSNQEASIEQVVVTAQKRTEKLMDVPASITAVGGERLEWLQVNSLSDLANYVPGMSVIGGGVPGSRDIILRGLNTSYANATVGATVGTYIDDVPIGLSGPVGRGAQYGADLQPYDIERVEVLKGPQGTLYGANTLGGLVKYVTRAPDLTAFDANLGTALEYTDNTGSPNWDAHGYVNFPIVADTFAVRLSAYKKGDAGYIDNVGIGDKNANSVQQQGGRLTALWKVNAAFSVRAQALYERASTANVTAVSMNGVTGQPLYGQLVLSTQFPEPYRQETQNDSLSINWDLGFATLTSATGWSKIYWTRAEDFSIPYGSFCAPIPAYGLQGCVDYPFANALALFKYRGDTSKTTEEVRLASPDGQRIQWIIGGFYTNETGRELYSVPTYTPSHVQLPDADNLLLGNNGPAKYRELAGFANLTYEIVDHFDVTGGARYSSYRESTEETVTTGVLYDNVPLVGPASTLPSVGVTNWMADARYRPDDTLMVYGRVATGFRPGYGCKYYSNGTPCGNPRLGVPGSVNSDRTTNFELGLKGQTPNQRLQVDLSVFYIKWKDIQVQTLTATGISYAGNGGNASSRGIEYATTFRPLHDLNLGATLAYTNAHLDQDAPGVNGAKGNQLPDAPRLTASATADYSHPLSSGASLLFGASYQYRDAIVNQFDHTGAPVPMGPQNIVNAYIGLVLKAMKLRLYGENIFNNNSYAGLQFINDPSSPRFVPTRPRTVGISADYQF